jgi:hypothetical protein
MNPPTAAPSFDALPARFGEAARRALPAAFFPNRYRFQVHEVLLPLPQLPPALDGLRLVQLSDFHAGNFPDTSTLARAAEAVARLDADLICFTGDLVDKRAEEFEPYIEHFRGLPSRHGIFSITGNHDYGDQVRWPSAAAQTANFERLQACHRAAGWDLLLNAHRWIGPPGAPQAEQIALIGIETRKVTPFRYYYGDLDGALRGSEQAALRILLCHQPDHWDPVVRRRYPHIALTLAGHTHGGQIGIETERWRYSPLRLMYRRWCGLYREGRQFLYVNRGLGFSPGSGRLGILPEITLFRLVKP